MGDPAGAATLPLVLSGVCGMAMAATVAAGASGVAAGAALAASFDAVEGHQWDRTGLRGDGARFTVDTFGRYFVHDPIHHLHDVGVPFTQP